MSRISRWPPNWGVALLLFASTATVFWPALSNGFMDMDHGLYVGNHRVKDGLTFDSLRWAFTFGGTQQWHPITNP